MSNLSIGPASGVANVFIPDSKVNLFQNIKAVLFDLDGTLVDTETLCTKTVLKVCEHFKIPLVKEDGNGSWGITSRKFYKELLEKKGLQNNLEEVLNHHKIEYEKLIQNGVPVFPGATTLPKKFKSLGYKLAVVSGSQKNQIELILNSLDIKNYFDLIVSSDDIKNSKPDPEGFLKAADLLGCKAKECLVIEDSVNGSKAGKNAGMIVIGVVNIGGQDLSSADKIVKDLNEIEELIN